MRDDAKCGSSECVSVEGGRDVHSARSAAAAMDTSASYTNSSSSQSLHHVHASASVDVDVDVERALAFEHARERFAMYGRQHAHVNHIAPERRRTLVAAASVLPATTLKHALRLQENGELALHLDDLNYRLDGVLVHCHWGDTSDDSSSSSDNAAVMMPSDEQLLASAQNVVALTQLLQREHVQRALTLASVSQSVSARMRRVIALIHLPPPLRASGSVGSSSAEALQLALAAMLFVLAQTRDADAFFSHEVVDLIAAVMRDAVAPASALEPPQQSCNDSDVSTSAQASNAAVAPPTTERSQLRRSCLKRKASTSETQRRARSLSTSSSSSDDVVSDLAPQISTTNTTKQRLPQRIERLLSAYDAFCVDGRALERLTVADVLVRVLHCLLQLEHCDGADHAATASRTQLRAALRSTASAAFTRVLARKQQLVDSRALCALVQALATRFEGFRYLLPLSATTSSAVSSPSPTPRYDECVRALWRAQSMLRVLDQASFLAAPVQQHLASQSTLFTVLLDLVGQLSGVCYRRRYRHQCQQQQSASDVLEAAPTASLLRLQTDVLLVTLRVLINLTHHNECAAREIHARCGTHVLFRAFCQLGGVVSEISRHRDALVSGIRHPIDTSCTNSSNSAKRVGALSTTFNDDEDDSVLFDAPLLCLSALMNCIEFSDVNRHDLATLELAGDDDVDDLVVTGLRGRAPTRACELLAHFFLCRVQSNLTLMQRSERSSNPNSDGNGDDPAVERSADTAQWVPEDVVIGGCASLLLGCLMADSSETAAAILAVLPHRSPQLLLRALSAFVALHSQFGALTPDVADSVLQVERTLVSFCSASDSTNAPAATPVVMAQALQIDVVQRSVDPVDARVSRGADREPACEVASQEVRTPPADAFKLQRWTRVCARVDSDSESVDGDSDAVKAVPFVANTTDSARKTTKSPNRRRAAKPPVARRSPMVSTTPPPRKPTSRSATPTRARQLVGELAQRLGAAQDAACCTPPPPTIAPRGDWHYALDDAVDELDFSRDRASRAPTTASPRESSPLTLSARRRRLRASRLQTQQSPRRAPLATALAAADSLTPLTRSPSVENALKRKRRVAATSTSSHQTCGSTAVFDFDA